MAGFSLPSKMVGRTFALVELVRSEADFLLAPVMIEVAQMWSGGEGKKLNATGIHHAIWVTLMITIGVAVIMVALYLLGKARLTSPDLKGWLKGDNPALESPPLLAALRKDL
jgi:hypothetical protein